MKAFNRLFILLSGIITTLSVASSCNENVTKSVDYKPIPLFAPAYEVISNVPDTGTFNLASTIKVIRALETAGTESGSFEAYLESLSRMDYRYVARDVIEAQKKMFPIMQEIYQKGEELGNTSVAWTLVQTAESALVQLGVSFLSSGSFDITGFLQIHTLASTLSQSFDQFVKAEKLKKDAAREFNSLRNDYYNAINECWPVFIKYKEEWEKLCIKKDQAYLDIYSGGTVAGYNAACEILEKYPDDREALLIKALSIVNRKEFGYDALLEVQSVLDTYISLYPTQTAPAFLIKGIIASKADDMGTAFNCFDQAAIEYPRQAEALTDMLDAYINRPYFSKTREGLYFQQMYRSTLEGYGFFSPNFQKALYYEKEGLLTDAGKEIYNHFFRRGNQAVFDYLLSDMEFCERYLNDSFSLEFPESGFIDIIVDKAGKSKQKVDLTNNTDVDLQNVRCFLCHHMLGMYPGDYVVNKLPPVTSIGKGQTYSWKAPFEDVSDIIFTRAILITDDSIFWVDNQKKKNEYAVRAIEDPFPGAIMNSSALDIDSLIVDAVSSIRSEIEKTSLLSGEDALKRNTKYVKVSVPRSLSIINPAFSLGNSTKKVIPDKVVLQGEYIVAYFPMKDIPSDMILYIYGKGHSYSTALGPVSE